MRMLLSADLHGNGEPARLKIFENLLEDHHRIAVVNKCRVIAYLGDLLDKRFGTSARVVLTLYKAIKKNHEAGIETWIIPGNHDIPYESLPEETLLQLFESHCKVFNEPEIMEGSDWGIVLMPYREPGEFIHVLREVTAEAVELLGDKRKILFTHTAIKEGLPGASNYKLKNYRVSVEHLHPNVYDLVLLGDFHRHQMLARNVAYLGAPVQFKHLDCDTVGCWLFSTKNLRLKKGILLKEYPEYRTYNLSDREPGDSLVIPGYSDFNHNRIRCSTKISREVAELYSDASLILETGEIDDDGQRLGKVDPEDPLSVLRELVRVKKLSKLHYQLGIKALQEVIDV